MTDKKNIFCKFVILACFISACNRQEKFDKNKWNEQADPVFPPACRNYMIKDLTTTHKLVGLKYDQIIKLLGEANFKDSNSVAYDIEEDYGVGIDPVYTKVLDFYFSKDSVITSFKVQEWKHGKLLQ